MRGDLSAVLITCLLMVIPALALSAALPLQTGTRYWPVSLNQLALVGAASVLFGYLLARSQVTEIVSLLATGLYCLATVGVLQILLAPGTITGRIVAVSGRLLDSLQILASGGNAQDPFLLILFLAVLFWFLGHNTAWHLFRIDRPWRSIIPPAVVLMINGLYNFNIANLNLYLIVYMFLALLLLARSNIESREGEWYASRIRFDRHLRRRLYQAGAIASVVIVAVAFLLPTGSDQQNQQRFQQFLSGDSFTQLNKLLNKLLTPLDTTNSRSSDYYGRDTLSLGGAIQLGNQPVLRVKAANVPADTRLYWQSRVFDTYQNNTWSSARSQKINSSSAPLNLTLPSFQAGTRQNVVQTITLESGPSELIYAAPQAVQIGLAAEADADVIDPQSHALNVGVIRPNRNLQMGDTYSAISSMSSASADLLRVAAVQYPTWVAPDLAIAPDIAPKSQAEAYQIIDAAKAYNPYDKAKAIEQWLRANVKYNEAMPTPPTGVDLVDWSLFTIREGYCTYYASAMVVMLRALHIPARMAAGFAQGDYDATSGTYLVRERDAHTWVQVYFPGAGWVEFEPTAAQPLLNRVDSQVAKPSATFTPSPTATFTPAPTITSTPQARPSATPNGTSQSQQQNPTSVQTLTPTVTQAASPTTTTTPPSLLPNPIAPESGLLAALLSLAVLVSIPIALVSFLIIGALWWFEYRGFGDLTPAARAYARLSLYSRWLRWPIPAGATPLERGRRAAREAPEQASAIVTITDSYVSERYAPPRSGTPVIGPDRVNSAWQSIRGGLIRRKIRSWFRSARKA